MKKSEHFHLTVSNDIFLKVHSEAFYSGKTKKRITEEAIEEYCKNKDLERIEKKNNKYSY